MLKIKYAKDLDKAKISNVGIGIDNKKIIRLYEYKNVNIHKVNDDTGNEEILNIMNTNDCLVELTFYHNESIDSLIRVLQSLKEASFIKEEENPEMYKKIKNALKED